MLRWWLSGIVLLFFMLLLCGCECQHEWTEATTESPKSCIRCGLTEGEALVTIPDIRGMREADANMYLLNRGLIPKFIYEYNDYMENGKILKTSPAVGEGIEKDNPITVVVSKGPKKYSLQKANGYMCDIPGIDSFSWENRTKGFYVPYVEDENLHIDMYIVCYSENEISFGGNCGIASLTEDFEYTIPADILYQTEKVSSVGGQTNFSVKIPLSAFSDTNPSHLYCKIDFMVGGIRQQFVCGFDLLW